MASDSIVGMAARIREHPAYAAAAWRHARAYAEWRDQLGPLNAVITNQARLRVLENLVYLHLLSPRRAAPPAATFERLAEFSGVADDVGARAVRTTLRLAEAAGLVVTRTNPADGREQLFRPTAAMLRHCRHSLAIFMGPLDAVFPHLNIGQRLAADAGFHRFVVIALASAYLQIGAERSPQHDGFRDILRLEGAAAIFNVAIDCFRSDRNLPSPLDLSRRFYLSESQARAVLKAAEAVGLIKTAPRGRLIDAEPLAQATSEAHLRLLAFFAHHIFCVDGEAAA